MSFNSCKSKSDLYEQANMRRMELLQFQIVDKAPEGIVTDGSWKKWQDFDFIVQKEGHIFNIEQKVDYVTYRTGNITVEFDDCLGNARGIFKGQDTDIIQYILPNEDETSWHLMVATRRTLKRLSIKHYKGIRTCGDQNGRYFLVPLEKLIQEPGIQYKEIELELTA